MDMTGQQFIPADRAAVWRALNDPDVLRRCIPGCEALEKLSDTEMTALAVVKVGPISARFQGQVTLSELDPPNGYRISGAGQGGVAGHARGEATVRLADSEGGTLLSYDVSAQIGGKLAQLGGRMIDATARTMAAAFFRQFADELAPGAAGGTATADRPAALAIGGPAVDSAASRLDAPPARDPWIALIAGIVVGAIAMRLLAFVEASPGPYADIVLAALAGLLVGRFGQGAPRTIVIERGGTGQ